MPNYSAILDPKGNTALTSLFGNTKFIPFPTGIDNGSENPHKAGTGNVTSGLSQNRNAMHNDDIYDISMGKIIDYTSKYPSMKITAAHFAYLKDVGVFPNNRLMVARRFPSPVGNDLTSIQASPLATLISWVPNESDYLNMTLGEHWEPSPASFEDVLNGAGKAAGASSDNKAGMGSLGSIIAAGANVIPLSGMMEGLQREVMKNMGIIDDKDPSILPQGNPNLIKEAMKRKLVEKGQAGSGLKCKFSIKMKVEYEQKYINGTDNSLSYFDLIANVLSFGTSDSEFMYNKMYASGATGFLSKLISGDIKAVVESITQFIDALVTALQKTVKNALDSIKKDTKTKSEKNDTSLTQQLVKDIAGSIIGKYKITILGIISALTGQASTPWHITLGNPQRPFFTSGDMLMEEVNMTMGPVLAWNDLPANLTIEFTLTNARALGAQEIMNRFNSGMGRSYVRIQPDFASSNSPLNKNGKVENNDFEYSSKLPSINTNFGQANSGGNFLTGNGTTTPLV